MDETGTAIAAQVAAKAATEIIKTKVVAASSDADLSFDALSPEWGKWYTLIGTKIVSTVKTLHPTEGPQTPSEAPGAPANGQGVLDAPKCPSHGLMLPVEQKAGSRRPLFKCNESKWDFQRKQEVGCPYVIWPADDPVGA